MLIKCWALYMYFLICIEDSFSLHPCSQSSPPLNRSESTLNFLHYAHDTVFSQPQALITHATPCLETSPPYPNCPLTPKYSAHLRLVDSNSSFNGASICLRNSFHTPLYTPWSPCLLLLCRMRWVPYRLHFHRAKSTLYFFTNCTPVPSWEFRNR